jgi:hypothetical protein
MKTTRQGPYRAAGREPGILILECIVYLALVFLIVGLGYVAFYRGWDNSANLRLNAEQIARALTTGERWREDVRTATGPLRLEESTGEQVLHLPHGSGEVTYRAAQGGIWRQASGRAVSIEVLDRVNSSRMQLDQRRNVKAWRWELELGTREKKRRIKPLLTFEAVPGAEAESLREK